VSEELLTIMQQDTRLCPHLHLPLQAGDDQMLLRMNRHYTLAQYQKLLQHIQGVIPDIGISTDIIVGFPGETLVMFENALQFVGGMDFSRMHIFPYSRRSGTPAADYADQVPEDEKKRRVHIMQALADKKAVEFQERFINRQLTVLFEPEQDGLVQGFTGNYIRVYARGHQGIHGDLHTVMLEKPYRDGLWGTIID
jgi:threonylcarbamoyladenosine tRNA methylthiotransferase MtaB